MPLMTSYISNPAILFVATNDSKLVLRSRDKKGNHQIYPELTNRMAFQDLVILGIRH